MPLQRVAAGTAPASAGKLLDDLALLRGIHDLALPTQVKTGDACDDPGRWTASGENKLRLVAG
jgi:hypothetical protein